MSYRVIIPASAERELDKLAPDMRRRILKHILALAQDPRPYGYLKMHGADTYRIRVGDYRVVYSIEDAIRIVTVIEVGHRRDIYR